MEEAESEIVSIDECGFQKRNEKVGENKFHECQHRQGKGGLFPLLFFPGKISKKPVLPLLFYFVLMARALGKIMAVMARKRKT